MKRVMLLVLVCVSGYLVAAAQERAGTASISKNVAVSDARRESFEIVWRTVKEKHFDPAFGGVDWDAVRRKYEPRLEQIKEDRELYQLLNEMLGELHQSHFAVFPPEAILEDGSLGSQPGGIGLDLRIIDDLATVTRIAPDSAAARAGLRPGFTITRIDGVEAAVLQKETAGRVGNLHWSPSFQSYLVAQVLAHHVGGQPGTVVRLQYLGENAQMREAAVEREKLSGELSQPIGYIPALRTEFEAKRLADGIGYIRFNYFAIPVMDKVRTALRDFKDAPGIIFDLRGNGGGVGVLAPGIVGYLETKQTSIGTMRMRTGQINFVAFPQSAPYTGPVAVLIDGGSGSTTEIFAAGIQELKRGVVIGERSAGAVLPSTFEKLPTGARFQYAHADFRTSNGVLLEGRGVMPDVEIKHSRAALLAGRDAQLEAAIEAVRSRPKAR